MNRWSHGCIRCVLMWTRVAEWLCLAHCCTCWKVTGAVADPGLNLYGNDMGHNSQKYHTSLAQPQRRMLVRNLECNSSSHENTPSAGQPRLKRLLERIAAGATVLHSVGFSIRQYIRRGDRNYVHGGGGKTWNNPCSSPASYGFLLTPYAPNGCRNVQPQWWWCPFHHLLPSFRVFLPLCFARTQS